MKRDLVGSLLTLLALLTLSGSARAADPPAKTCREELGAKKATKLVKQCIEVSPATHPPCNDANPCA